MIQINNLKNNPNMPTIGGTTMTETNTPKESEKTSSEGVVGSIASSLFNL